MSEESIAGWLNHVRKAGASCIPALQLLHVAVHETASGYGFFDHARGSFAVPDRRLAKTDADVMETPEVTIRQIGIAFPDVVDRLVHPVLLIFLSSLQDAATMHVAEQLVTCTLQ